MKLNKIKKYCSAALLIGVTAMVTLNSCTEEIDESNLYTFTGEMMVDHFEKNPEVFSSYLTILGKVHMSKRSSSTVRELLSARGHYTCFAPTNEAVQEYLDSLYSIGQLESNALEEISDSVAEAIVFNSIIQHGENEAYSTTDFTDGALNRTNMNDRYISIRYDTDANNNTLIYVNINSLIIDGDIEVENGFIHTIDKVISPSNASIADLVMAADNMKFFGSLLALTGWEDKVLEYKDEAWEELHDKDGRRGEDYSSNGYTGRYPEHRYIGYTIFVEPDEVYASHNITNIESLKEWVKANNYYDDDTSQGHTTSWGDDYTDDYNWLNQFVAYHILPERLTYNNMVTFANEYGRNAALMQKQGSKIYDNHYVNVWEYWETMGVQRRSLKITGCKDGIIERRINRVSTYYNNNYKEDLTALDDVTRGINIFATNGNNETDALNGTYYPISDILIWNANVPNRVLNERMRYDVTSLFPELLTNNIRQNRDCSWIFTPDYMANVVDMSNETTFFYLPNTNMLSKDQWLDYQIDEFNVQGNFDFTMKLPPVPYTGTYEIRYGINANDKRGMAQVYLGTNKDNLPAIGIPLDLRDTGAGRLNTGWVPETDLGNDELSIQENTKSMRNLGYMKGPKYMTFGDDNGNTYGRSHEYCLRKIIYTGTLEAGKTYYIRYKSVLEGTTYEFFYDYLEIVPKTVYAGDKPEDIW